MGGELIIPKKVSQPIRGIHSPEVQVLAESLGKISIDRASHVEPGSNLSGPALEWLFTRGEADPNLPSYALWGPLRINAAYATRWFADCLPVKGPVLGPYDSPDEARAAEVEWLKANNVPVCDNCYRTQIQPITTPVLTEEDLHKQ